ncbi:MAG: sulfite oxidase-like oxidoreductase [Candidatus Methanoperedens sp.]|nr:sulfite oxidase-like oxidoreductase [Candidatus Methanoperedens sp.]
MQRLPPNQRLTPDFPILHFGNVPEFDRGTWDIRVEGFVKNPIKMTYDELLSLKKTESISDFHCVTGWSRFDNKWEGVRFSAIAELAMPKENTRFVTIECDGGYTTSLPVSELMEPDVLLAYAFNGEPLESAHGGPLRLVVPKKYAYKCAKWVRRVVFTEEQELGFWEQRGYSNTADPWKEERYSY